MVMWHTYKNSVQEAILGYFSGPSTGNSVQEAIRGPFSGPNRCFLYQKKVIWWSRRPPGGLLFKKILNVKAVVVQTSHCCSVVTVQQNNRNMQLTFDSSYSCTRQRPRPQSPPHPLDSHVSGKVATPDLSLQPSL